MSLGVPRMGVYISQLIRFARASFNVGDFNCNKALTANLLKQGYRYHYRYHSRHSGLVEIYNVGLKKLLQQALSELEFYGDFVYKFRKSVEKSNFSEQFIKLVNRYKRI